MPEHEQFEELSALAAIGQLSEEELRELLAHLRQCEKCKQARDEFEFILGQLAWADPPEIAEDSAKLLGESHRHKFLARASADGLRFSNAALASAVSRPKKFLLFPGRRLWVPAAVAACFVLAVLWLSHVHRYSRATTQRTASVSSSPAARHPLPPTASTQASADFKGGIIQEFAHEMSVLKQQLALANEEKNRIETETQQLRQQVADLLTVANRNAENYSAASSQLEKLQKEQAQFLAEIVGNQNKIRELNEQIATERASVEREQQLTGAAQDVRELMAARNLHIIDVYDFDARKRRDNSFGRVFYATGKCLIFYAFDLGQKGAASKVRFQAWGQAEGRTASAKNLGIFHVDDRAQKTWVLRVDDPQLLSSIDSVFVTVEPPQGADQPSGKKLLYAYLGAPANHP
jgi:hypothetical protein